MAQSLSLATPFVAPEIKTARLIEFRARSVGKSEFTRRAALAGRLKAAANRATDSAVREVWLRKASQCGYLPSTQLRGPTPEPVSMQITVAPPRDINLMPIVRGLVMASIVIAMTGVG